MTDHIDGCEYPTTENFNPDCPECMHIWANFLDEQNIFVITGGSDDATKRKFTT